MTTYRLTVKQKRAWRDVIIQHYGYVCYYCKGVFVSEYLPLTEEWDHLNCKEYDNRIENVVLAHRECNNKKKYNPDWQILGKEQLKQNESTGVLGMWERERKKDKHSHAPAVINTEEIFSHSEFVKITQQYLDDCLDVEQRIPYKLTLDSITMKCFDQIGHASQNTIRRILDMLCSPEGKYEIVRDGGKRWIQKRNQGLFSV